jgi:hypothetical protein
MTQQRWEEISDLLRSLEKDKISSFDEFVRKTGISLQELNEWRLQTIQENRRLIEKNRKLSEEIRQNKNQILRN